MKRIMTHYGWILSLLLAAFGWVWALAADQTAAEQRLSELERRLEGLSQRRDHDAQSFADLSLTLTEVQTDVRWIRQEIERLRR